MRGWRVVAATVALGSAIALIPASPAWACSCAESDPSLQITLEITDSAVTDAPNPWGGDDSFGGTVDLRGAAISVIGEVPARLEGTDLEAVPVLATVLDDPGMSDSCNTPHRPAVGSDIEATGTVTDEGAGTFIYAGPCSGSFTVLAGPAAAASAPSGGGTDRGPWVPVAVGAGGVLVAGLIAGGVLWRPRRDA